MKVVDLRSELLIPLAIFLLGLGASGEFAYVLYRGDALEHERNAEIRAKRSAEAVAEAVDAFGDKVVSLAAFLHAAPNVSREQFAQVVRRTMSRYETAPVAKDKTPAVGFALSYAPWVAQRQRQAFEQAARASGMKDFVIFDRVSGGKAPAANRPFHYPVYYIEPYAGNEGAVGFDLYSEPVRREAIDRALSAGKMRSTSRISLVQEAGVQYGVLLLAPVSIGSDGRTAAQDSGFASGVLRISQLVSTVAAAREDKVFLLDRSAPQGQQLLHPRLADEGAAIASLGTLVARHPLQIGGRDWEVLVSIPPFEPASAKYFSVLMLGLLGFGGMAVFIGRSARGTARALNSSRELKKALDEVAPKHSQIELQMRQSGAYIMLSTGFATGARRGPRAPAATGAATNPQASEPLRHAPALHTEADIRLPIARRIVALHGGQLKTVDADSARRGGPSGLVSFTLVLPTGAMLPGGRRLECADCPTAQQAQAYARDLAALMSGPNPGADVSGEEVAFLMQVMADKPRK